MWIYIPRWHFPVPTPFGDYINIKGPEHGPPPPAVEPTQANGVQRDIVRAPVRLTGGGHLYRPAHTCRSRILQLMMLMKINDDADFRETFVNGQ